MTTPRDDIAGLSESEPTKEQIAACESAMDGLDAQADIWAEEIALVNIVKNLGDLSRGLTDRMPTDVRDGFINRQEAQIDALTRQAYSEGFYRGGESRKEYDDAQNATQLDSLLKERDALQARVKELDGRYLGAVAARGMLRDRADEAESRATRLQQERDEAYERAAAVADKKADDLLDAAARLQVFIGATKLAYTEADLHEQTGTAIKVLVDDIRRLAGPEKIAAASDREERR